MYVVNKYLDRSQTINNIVYIIQSIGLYTDKLTLNHVGAIMTVYSLALIVKGIRTKNKESNEKDATLSSFVHSIIFCVLAIGFYVLILLYHYGII